ncbi:hypothetical protein AB1N83_012559 [Pleurotus pulmonarius]
MESLKEHCDTIDRFMPYKLLFEATVSLHGVNPKQNPLVLKRNCPKAFRWKPRRPTRMPSCGSDIVIKYAEGGLERTDIVTPYSVLEERARLATYDANGDSAESRLGRSGANSAESAESNIHGSKRTTTRLLYKTDGTPRSKFTGLAIASLATLSFLLYEALAVIDELDHSAHLLAALLHVQRADYRLFAATNLADPVHLLRLYRALQAPDSDSDAGEKVYSYEKLRAILRETCEGVHDILHDPLEEAHELAAASKIVDLLDASFGEVLRILEHQHQHQHRHEQKREGVARAEEHPRGEEYEVVG